jgi:hypothetical protein
MTNPLALSCCETRVNGIRSGKSTYLIELNF